jgi:hypothetical protein
MTITGSINLLAARVGLAGARTSAAGTQPGAGGDFADSLVTAVINFQQSSGASAPPGNTRGTGDGPAPAVDAAAQPAASSKLQDALAAFEKEARKTPAERAHDQILAKHNLSEDSYKALSPEEKKSIDQEIVERTRLLIKGAAGNGAEPPSVLS